MILELTNLSNMDWQDKIYESLVTETRSKQSRVKSFLTKRSAEIDKRHAKGKSIGALGAGTRARKETALAKKATAPNVKRHHQGEADRLKSFGKNYKANQEAANKDRKKKEKLARQGMQTVRRLGSRAVSENVYDLEKGKMKPKVKRGDPFAHLPKELRMKILAGKALRGGGAKKLAQNIDRSGGPKK